jgi:23S rRNA (adenine2030-N6)-methyltransferase
VNYRHAFHAGNFADVHKHIVLLLLLEHLHKKSTPFFFLDTHAGRGLYDLQSDDAKRGNEAAGGITLLREASPPEFANYLRTATAKEKIYPGSPLIAVQMLRDNDRAVFVEKHAEEAQALKRALGRRARIAVLNDDGYAALKAHLPPEENRGLVLIDPPYESDTEFADAAQALQMALKHWPNGIYALWFPIKPGASELRLYRTLTNAGIKKILLSTLNIRPSNSPLGLNGSGVLIVNPPWQLDEQLRALMPKLQLILARHGSQQVQWLAGE